tara:strand:+ start:87 stop:713 length:627 start_codon:yes stop_codon:yes gene_type:complete
MNRRGLRTLAKRKSFEEDTLNAIYDHDLSNAKEIAEFTGASVRTTQKWLKRFRDNDQVKSERGDSGGFDYEPLDESFEDVEITYKMTYENTKKGNLEIEITTQGRVETGLSDDEVLKIMAERSQVDVLKGLAKIGSNATRKVDGKIKKWNNTEHLATDQIWDKNLAELVEDKSRNITGIERKGKHNRSKKSVDVEGQFRGNSGNFFKI